MAAGGQNRLFDGLFADPEVAALFSAETMLAQFMAFECALTRAQGRWRALRNAERAVAHMETVRLAPEGVAARVRRDGVPVPAFVAALRAEMGADADAVHQGATSQDVMDTSLALSLRGVSDLLDARLANLLAQLATLTRHHGATPLMGRTRMQAALPMTVADRLASWTAPLERTRARLPEIRAGVEHLQLGGPVGVRAPEDDAVAADMAKALGLQPPGLVWHATRDGVVAYGNWLALVSGSLGKMGQDLALMAQQGLDEVRLSGGGASSAMPHKQNPIAAEILVTLSRFNATQISGLHHAMVHEQERSGAAWSLEWMILPQMCEATGAALLHARDLLDGIERLGTPTA
ncbi:3-carboxy-cis,cis-muconate cycloisomerase [Dinoroseobacter sp. S124A]|uniref:3-carboxy-cis,cis-muconate cycloisomerase n=1 Tax=Dinoroseobacter sp. S124A TaxID=3415128 RepID=UPI003C7C301F